MRLDSVKGVAVATLKLEDMDMRPSADGCGRELLERVRRELFLLIDRCIIEGPVLHVEGDTIQAAFAVCFRPGGPEHESARAST